MLVLKDVLEPLLRPIYSGGGEDTETSEYLCHLF